MEGEEERRGERKRKKNSVWLINPLSHHWTSSISNHMFHGMAAEWSITDTAFLDSKPPQEPCVMAQAGSLSLGIITASKNFYSSQQPAKRRWLIFLQEDNDASL